MKNIKAYRAIVLLFTFFILASTTAWAYGSKKSFSSITINDGLSNNTVFDIIQDNKGIIWVGTSDGLNKYDGSDIQSYRHDPENSNTLISNHIRVLSLSEENLLIGTNIGLSIYNTRMNTFTNYLLHEQVNDIIIGTDARFYLITTNKVILFDGEVLETVYENPHLINQTASLLEDDILLGTRSGLYRLNKTNRSLMPFDERLNDKYIQRIELGADGLWIATEGSGLYFLGKEGSYKHYQHGSDDSQSLSSNYIRTIQFDAENKLWIGTFNGLNILDVDSGHLESYHSSDVNRYSLNQNSVRSLYNDAQGGMWIGTYFGGINYYHPLQNQFNRLSHIPNSNTLSDHVVSSIVEDEDGLIWIGTNDNGLNKYNPKTEQFSYFTKRAGGKGLKSNNIKTIITSGNYCYIGSHGGGVAQLERSTGKITVYHKDNSQLISNNVYALELDKKRNLLWIGTLNGLVSFDLEKKEFVPLSAYQSWGEATDLHNLSTGQIYVLYMDSNHRLWIGTDFGVYTYSYEKNLISHYEIDTKEQNGRINCFYEDHLGQIWIGTASGLRLLHTGSQSFKTYTTKDGLPNNNVLGILQDSYYRYWISTNQGLVCFTPTNGRMRVYTHLDGLPSDQFSQYSYCKSSSGELYFGGINGITYFKPERIKDNTFTPQPIITGLKVLSEEVNPNDDHGILQQAISFTKQLRLKPSQNSFTLSFAVPNYLSAQHNVFAYRLEGLDTEWHYMTQAHPVSYSNLPPGTYTFLLKAGNGEDKWNNNPTYLDIEVLPYWWETIWFRVFIIVFFLTFIYAVWRFFNKRQKLENQLKIERLEQKQKEEINQMKLRFFINISHEFRTPLTLIISPLEELLQRTRDKWTIGQIKLMQRNANKLLYLVNQLLDYRRAELGVFALKVKEDKPIAQIENIMSMYDRLAQQKQIDFNFYNAIPDQEQVLYDASYLELIVSNLLSNAFKFTPNQGKISIRTSLEANSFMIQVTDTGQGIDTKDLERIFERFYQSNYQSKGTGIGLSVVNRLVKLHHGHLNVESAKGEGATFTICLPQNKEVYAPHEFLQEGEVERKYTLSLEVVDHIEVNDASDADEQDAVLDETAPTLLIVEDDTDVRNYLKESFKGGARIYTSDNGLEPLEIVKTHKIDLIISDVMLPEQSGIKLCRALKQNIKTSHIPIILLTAKASPEDQLEGLTAGADDYIYKPFQISLLKKKVENRLKLKKRMLEHYSNHLEVAPADITFNEMDREFLEKAKEIVEQNLDNVNFQVDDFCEQMAMSRSNLHLKMKAITGESTIEFIKKIRFNEACKLLQDGRYSVAEVSAMVGFNTPSYFTTSFKKHFGMLPTDYIKRTSN